MKDISKAKFRKECERYGFKPTRVWGYYALPDVPVQVSVFNAGPSRREQLAYLIREHQKAIEKYGEKAAIAKAEPP